MFYIFDMIVCGLQLIENGRQKIPLCSGATSRIRVAQYYPRYHTVIPYRVSTGPEQGFPCVVNSHREKPVFITGKPYSSCMFYVRKVNFLEVVPFK